jgi:hypothetical protein
MKMWLILLAENASGCVSVVAQQSVVVYCWHLRIYTQCVHIWEMYILIVPNFMAVGNMSVNKCSVLPCCDSS